MCRKCEDSIELERLNFLIGQFKGKSLTKAERNFKILKFISVFFILFVNLITFVFVSYSIKAYGLFYYKKVKKICNDNNIDTNLIMAVIKTESSFSPTVISQKGAVGFMQILPSTAEWVCEIYGMEFESENLIDYKYNVNLGSKYLLYLMSKFDLNWAIVAYNAGENNVSEWLKQGLTFEEIPFKESRNYLNKVLSNLDYYNSLFS